jgi:hypothetical protein
MTVLIPFKDAPGYVYRNPEGSHKDRNAFVDVNAVVMDYFTVGPKRPAKSDVMPEQK